MARRSRTPSSSSDSSDGRSRRYKKQKADTSTRKEKEGTKSFSKHGKRERGRSPSSSSSSSRSQSRSRSRSPRGRGGGSDGGGDRNAVRDEERRRARRQEKLEARKRERRAKETPAERAARKMKKASAAALFGYTNESNPFLDANLDEQFVWRKKVEKTGAVAPDKREQRLNHVKKVEEIVKVRKRREDTEKEKEEMERLRAEEARLREQQQYGDWQKKEEEFHLAQAKMRSKIRLVEGREKAIDMMAKNVLLFGETSAEEVGVKYRSKSQLDTSALEMELREPYRLFEGLSLVELIELQRDIAEYVELEGDDGPNAAFWRCLAVVCAEELRVAKAREGIEEEALRGVHPSLLSKVHDTLAPLSLDRLGQMAREITSQLEAGAGAAGSEEDGGGGGGLDSDYYGLVLRFIGAYEAKAELRAIHQRMLQRQLDRLEDVRREARRMREAVLEDGGGAAAAAGGAASGAGAGAYDEEGGEEGGGGGGVGAAAAVGGRAAGRDESEAAAELYRREAKRGMEDLEDAFGLKDEVDTSGVVYGWGDRYRPRKPRYFNRVKTGYDWNKYNQAHYDHDNPPPKAVQGYKFNIFYPDLVDKSKAPRFVLEPADTNDFVIIRFTAGPPYEDVAFKIVNREWETSRKRGFRVVFDRGVMSVIFNFKRARYRR